MPLKELVALAATLALVACGGTSAPLAPAPTSVPAAVSATVGQPAPTASPTSVASVAAAASKPTAAPNANAGSVAGSADPCKLITRADYLAVMGDAANDPVKRDRPTVATSGLARSSCEYKIAAGGKVEFVTVNVMQRDASTPAQIDTKTYWEGTKKAWTAMQAKVTPLPEIGPEAFLVVNPLLEQIGAGGAVYFLKGDVIFDVQVATGSGTVDEQNTAGTVAAKKLAIVAFGRL